MTPSELHVEVAALAVDPASLQSARASLSADELKRAARFLRDEDRDRFVAARGMLRGILGRALGIAPGQVAFVYGPHGKPALVPAQADSGIRFNLSHSAGRALVAWTTGGELGADLELVRPVRFGAKIARRYFSDDEQASFESVDAARWDETFFRCWTRKEAFVKAVGDGLSHPLRSFTVPMAATEAGAFVRVHCDATASRRWLLSTVEAEPGFLAAVVAERCV